MNVFSHWYLEELSATQEESTRKSEELEHQLRDYKIREVALLQKIEELESREKGEGS